MIGWSAVAAFFALELTLCLIPGPAVLFTVAVPHGLTDQLDFSAADVVVESLDQLTLSAALERSVARNATASGPWPARRPRSLRPPPP